MRSASNAGLIVTVVIVSVILGAAGGFGGAYFFAQEHPPTEGGGAVAPPPSGREVSVVTDQEAIVEAVKRADPSVVKIVSTTVREPSSPYEYFFGGGPQVQQGLGSGFLFDYDGRKLVLTNNHVVGGAQEIDVQTRSGEKFRGKTLGADRSWDVAVVELEGDVSNLPTVTLGDSDELQLGEWVIAIGHPFAFDHTVTVGVVSAMGERPIGPSQNAPVRNVIQTDAAINQGNSGGPLINLAGDVVGINSMIFSPTGATVGIGFAIPVNDVRQIVHFLMERGPWVGIETVSNDQARARVLGLTTEKGLIVANVVNDSPAQKAGLQQGDVILRIDGRDVNLTEELRSAIFDRNIGDTIAFSIQRGDKAMDVDVTAGRVPEGYFR